MSSTSSLANKINNAPNLDFGDIFNRAVELFKKVWVQGLLLQIIVLLISLPFTLTLYWPMVSIMMEEMRSGVVDPDVFDGLFYGMSTLYVISYYGIIFLLNVMTYLIYSGFYNIVRKIDHGEEVQISDFFHYVKGQYLGRMVLLVLAMFLISFIAMMMCVLPIFYAMIPLMFFLPFFAFNPEMSIGDIVDGAFRLGTKKWLITFGLVIVTILILIPLVLLTCGLGVFFFASFIYLPTYLIYKDVIGFNNKKSDVYDIRVSDDNID